MGKRVALFVMVVLLQACSGNPPKEAAKEAAPAQATPPAAAASAATNAVAGADVQAAAVPATPAVPSAAANQPAAVREEPAAPVAAAADALSKRSVFFPFDVDTVQPGDVDVIQAHARNLADHAGYKVRVEGNADERGSSEYNLALGQRRADNTRKALTLAGARAAQIETMSYGEEKPRAPGHDEAAWAQNRRADIVYSSGK